MKSVTGIHAKWWYFRPGTDGCAAIPWEMVDPAFKITAQRQLLYLLKYNFGNKHMKGEFKRNDFSSLSPHRSLRSSIV